MRSLVFRFLRIGISRMTHGLFSGDRVEISSAKKSPVEVRIRIDNRTESRSPSAVLQLQKPPNYISLAQDRPPRRVQFISAILICLRTHSVTSSRLQLAPGRTLAIRRSTSPSRTIITWCSCDQNRSSESRTMPGRQGTGFLWHEHPPSPGITPRIEFQFLRVNTP